MSKCILMDNDLHIKVKLEATKKNTSIKKLVETAVKKYLKEDTKYSI